MRYEVGDFVPVSINHKSNCKTLERNVRAGTKSETSHSDHNTS